MWKVVSGLFVLISGSFITKSSLFSWLAAILGPTKLTVEVFNGQGLFTIDVS